MLYYMLSASCVIILSIITITIRLLVQLQAPPCPTQAQAITTASGVLFEFKPLLMLMRHPSNLLKEGVLPCKNMHASSDNNIVSTVQLLPNIGSDQSICVLRNQDNLESCCKLAAFCWCCVWRVCTDVHRKAWRVCTDVHRKAESTAAAWVKLCIR